MGRADWWWWCSRPRRNKRKRWASLWLVGIILLREHCHLEPPHRFMGRSQKLQHVIYVCISGPLHFSLSDYRRYCFPQSCCQQARYQVFAGSIRCRACHLAETLDRRIMTWIHYRQPAAASSFRHATYGISSSVLLSIHMSVIIGQHSILPGPRPRRQLNATRYWRWFSAPRPTYISLLD